MERTLQRLADLLLDAVFLVREDGVIAFVNPASSKLLGYQPQEMIGRSLRDFIHPEDLSRTVAEMGHVMGGRPASGFENRYLRKDGSVVHFMWNAYWSAEEKLRIGVARDISQRKYAEERQDAMLRLSTAAHSAESPAHLFAATEAALQGVLPLRALAAVLEPDARMVYPADGSRRVSTGWHGVALATTGASFGHLYLDLYDAAAMSPSERELMQFAASQAAAAIERFALQAELAHAARYDELTGLPNRRLFHDRIQSAFARCRRGHSGGALLFIDLDDFKGVNDRHGHAVGDQLLQTVAQRISACVREADTVARLGGDEFVALLEDVADHAQAEAVARKIHKSIGQVAELSGVQLQILASIGIALYPLHGDAIDLLMRHADQAMYASKAQRKAQRAAG
jgi:diguanylate cyclase (GGDEF)-like protein/PAS domain S-box-containing protein